MCPSFPLVFHSSIIVFVEVTKSQNFKHLAMDSNYNKVIEMYTRDSD